MATLTENAPVVSTETRKTTTNPSTTPSSDTLKSGWKNFFIIVSLIGFVGFLAIPYFALPTDDEIETTSIKNIVKFEELLLKSFSLKLEDIEYRKHFLSHLQGKGGFGFLFEDDMQDEFLKLVVDLCEEIQIAYPKENLPNIFQLIFVHLHYTRSDLKKNHDLTLSALDILRFLGRGRAVAVEAEAEVIIDALQARINSQGPAWQALIHWWETH